MPQAKTQRVNEEQTTPTTEGTYEEIHAAIEELFRLMGVPVVDPAGGYQVPSGYAAYTYPSAAQQLPQPPVATANHAAGPPWGNNQQVVMASPPAMNPPSSPSPAGRRSRRPGQWAPGSASTTSTTWSPHQ